MRKVDCLQVPKGTTSTYASFCESVNPGMNSRIQAAYRQIQAVYGTTTAISFEQWTNAATTDFSVRGLPLDRGDWEHRKCSLEDFVTDPEFLGSELAPADRPTIGLRDVWFRDLKHVMEPNNHISHVFIEAAIGSGKTTASVVAALYKSYELLCLKNPQQYFGLMPSMPIVIFIASVTKNRASNVSFELLRNMIERSPFFMKLGIKITQDQIELPKNVSIEIGSQPRHALGSAIYCAILDEANFGARSTPQEFDREGQMTELFWSTYRRIESRFRRPDGYVAGQIFVVSSKRAKNDALHRLIAQERALKIPTSYVIEHTLWEALAFVRGKPSGLYSGAKFRMLIGDQFSEPRVLADGEQAPPGSDIIEVPVELKPEFERDPDGALRDLANVAVDSTTKLIRIRERLNQCVDSLDSFFNVETIVLDFHGPKEIMDHLNQRSFRAYVSSLSHISGYSLHIDTGLTEDALAISLSHATQMTVPSTDDLGQQIDTAHTTYTNDFTIRIKNVPGKAIPLFKIVRFVLFLKNNMRVTLSAVSTDGFQSAAIIQPLAEQNIEAKIVSVDRTDDPYLCLRGIIYDNKLRLLYRYDPLITELLELNHFPGDKKVDHPQGGRKDCADALCGSIWNLTQAIAANLKSADQTIPYIFQKEIEREMRRRRREEDNEEWGWL